MRPVSHQLESFLDEQLGKLKHWNPEFYEEGLILDFLYEHVASKSSPNQLATSVAEEIYSHTDLDVLDLVEKCKELDILAEVPTGETGSPEVTHLANRAFVPMVRERFRQSKLPGQRARKILEHRSSEWKGTSKGKGNNAVTRALHAMLAVLWKLINAGKGKEERVTLHAIDVQTVERGRVGMRAFRIEEENLLDASQAEVRIFRNVLLGLLMMTVAFFVSIAWVSNEKTKAERLNYAAVVISQAESLLKDNDPLTAALLVASLIEFDVPPNGVRVAHEISKHSIAKVILEHDANVNSVACSSDGNEVLIASDNGRLIWDTSGREQDFVRLDDTLVLGAIFNRSTEGPRLATFTADNEIMAWDNISRTVVDEENGGFREETQWCKYLVGVHDDEIVSLDFSAGGSLLLASSSNEKLLRGRNPPQARSEIRVWEVTDLNADPLGLCPSPPMIDQAPRGILGSFQKATFSNGDSHHFAIVRADASAAIILSAVDNQPVNQQVFQFTDGESGAVPIKQVQFSLDNRWLLLVHRDAPATLWTIDLTGREAPVNIPVVFPEFRKAQFIDSDRLLTVSMDNEINIWQLKQVDGEGDDLPTLLATPVMEFVHIGEKFKDMDYCRSAKQIVTSLAMDVNGVHEVRMWSGQGAIEPMRISYSALDYSVRKKLISVDEKNAFTINTNSVTYPPAKVSDDGAIDLRGVKIFTHSSTVRNAAINQGKDRLATASTDGLVRVFDINVSKDALSDGPGTMFTNTESLRIFSVGRRKNTPTVNAAAIDVDFSSDGSLLMGASNEGKIWIWRLEGKGQSILIDTGVANLVSAGFGPTDSPLGDRIQTTTLDGDVQFWRYQWRDLVQALNDSTVLCLTPEQREIYLPELNARRIPMNERCKLTDTDEPLVPD